MFPRNDPTSANDGAHAEAAGYVQKGVSAAYGYTARPIDSRTDWTSARPSQFVRPRAQSNTSSGNVGVSNPTRQGHEEYDHHTNVESQDDAGEEGSAHAEHPNRKRPRVSESHTTYSRKRSATACQVCRIRKTKCDNQRPACSTCLTLNVECVYQERKPDVPQMDNSSLAILHRIDHAIQLLETQGRQLSMLRSQQSTPNVNEITSSNNGELISEFNNTNSGSLSHGTNVDGLAHNATTLTEALNVSANCASGRILQWPIFEGMMDISQINAYFFDSNKQIVAEMSPPSAGLSASPYTTFRTSRPGRGMREEDAVVLVQEFLQKVHIKNPILDPAVLMEMAYKVAEEGFKWDESSCLVLIACGVANLASDFSPEKPSASESSFANAKDYSTAEQYYTGARKRIGLLENLVMATQCHFLLGVYEMYSLRPLKAWFSFSNACMVFQTYLHSNSRGSRDHSIRRLEQRLYWSCLKSECEMRDEVNLPPSGLAKADYPDVFPSPPGDTPEPEETGRRWVSEQMEPLFQRSWYYYLSEIATRRIANRIATALHNDAPAVWLSTSSTQLERVAEELDAQVWQWSDNLPLTFAEESSPGPPDELNFMLRARFLELRERIWRPFLFKIIHAEGDGAQGPRTQEYAERALSLVVQYINQITIKHRHHGSWYGARQGFTKALLLLAAAKSGRIALPDDWLSKVVLVQSVLGYWEDEAPDLRMARLALSDILRDIQGKSHPSGQYTSPLAPN